VRGRGRGRDSSKKQRKRKAKSEKKIEDEGDKVRGENKGRLLVREREGNKV